MKEPAISVIVPVYKAEKYLHRCVDSLLAQTFQDFEVLLVDDGSPDRSGEICDGYAKKDSRIRVFHKENGGVSSARQCGIDNARGEYTIHADPDDWVEPEMLEELYKKAKEDDADIVVCDFYEEYRNRRYYKMQSIVSEPQDNIENFFREKLHSSCWNKLIKKDIYIDHQIEFPLSIGLWEDMATMPRLFYFANKIAYLPFAYYHYVRDDNPNSYTKCISMKDKMGQKDVIRILENFFLSHGEKNAIYYLNYLKLNVRLSLIYAYGRVDYDGCINYPEANVVIWKSSKIPWYNKAILYLNTKNRNHISNFLLKNFLCLKSLLRS